MTEIIKALDLLPQYTGIFVLMFSTFLIGYFSSLWFQKSKFKDIIKSQKKKIDALKKKHNAMLRDKSINDIDTIFTEIKPKIIKVVKETQEKLVIESQEKIAEEIQNLIVEEEVPLEEEIQIPKSVAEKTRTSYITYTKSKPELNFKNFGTADSSNKDDLTKIEGIGPYIEEKLNEIGIFNYDQISRFTFEDIRILTELIDFFPGRIERDDWVGQANTCKVH